MSTNIHSRTRARAFVPRYTVDWWRVITDLGRGGMSHQAIATECGVDKSVITRLRNGGHHAPLYTTGVQILALWMDRFDKAAPDVPMVGVVLTSPLKRCDSRALQPPGVHPDVRRSPDPPSPWPTGTPKKGA